LEIDALGTQREMRLVGVNGRQGRCPWVHQGNHYRGMKAQRGCALSFETPCA